MTLTLIIPSKTISSIMQFSRNVELKKKRVPWGNMVITKSIPSCHRSPPMQSLLKKKSMISAAQRKHSLILNSL